MTGEEQARAYLERLMPWMHALQERVGEAIMATYARYIEQAEKPTDVAFYHVCVKSSSAPWQESRRRTVCTGRIPVANSGTRVR